MYLASQLLYTFKNYSPHAIVWVLANHSLRRSNVMGNHDLGISGHFEGPFSVIIEGVCEIKWQDIFTVCFEVLRCKFLSIPVEPWSQPWIT